MRPQVAIVTSFDQDPDYYFRRPFNFLYNGQTVSALDENIRFMR